MIKYDYAPILRKENAGCGACLTPFPDKEAPLTCPFCGKAVVWKNFPVMKIPFVPLAEAEWDIKDFPERFNLREGKDGKYSASIPAEQRESVTETVSRIMGIPETTTTMTDITCEVVSVTRKAPYMALARLVLASVKTTYRTEIYLYLPDGEVSPYVMSIQEIAA